MQRLQSWLAITVLLGLVLTAGSASAQHPQERRGFWAGFGAGYGTLGCGDCNDRESGPTAYIRLGGTPSQKLLVGFESNAWAKSIEGHTVEYVNGLVIVQYYPSPKTGFHLDAGAGAAYGRLFTDIGGGAQSIDEQTGFGATAGLGYDIRVTESVSITPGVSALFGALSDTNANLFRFLIGITWH